MLLPKSNLKAWIYFSNIHIPDIRLCHTVCHMAYYCIVSLSFGCLTSTGFPAAGIYIQ
jgi:hypothetical protein